MANIKSAKKRILQSEKRSEINRKKRSMLRSKVKSIHFNLEKKDSREAKKLFMELEPALARSVNKRLFKKNTVSRTLSKISKKIKLLK
ncbi:MAG: 30S ribosomal protein S20 [Rickettsiales bacterium TMED254]|nr:30S ribosomal protein S20 [Rickettsiales bacterium]RPF77532.1 MAG: 30S ribosomal protein S20 [Rickettsiales bacterium TMED254]|tara:strand:- start:452 stop:715 length:264 start_codon:yes stop_codon:yes gene_type:complete